MALLLDMILTRPMQHYNVEVIGEYQYRFDTDQGITYILTFVYIGGNENLPIYAFNIDRLAERNSNGDGNMIRNTVAYVIDLFFQNESNAILSTCDNDDKDSSTRYRLFRMWFNSIHDDTVVRKERQVRTGDGYTWALLYYKRDNIIGHIIEQYFDDYADMMDELFGD